VQVSFDKEAVAGRHCIMVDDLCDSGLTLLTVSVVGSGLRNRCCRQLLLIEFCRCWCCSACRRLLLACAALPMAA
jgi:hypoxanthine-guanine phosphoribosyltransferase